MEIYWTAGDTLPRLSLMAMGWAAVSLVFVVLWLIEWRRGDASLVDAGWAGSLGLLALLYASLASGDLLRRVAMGLLVGAWSFRLSAHIIKRHWRAGEEDSRYRSLRASWDSAAHAFFFIFYQAQGALAVLLSIPFVLIAFNASPDAHVVELGGFGLAAVALIGESVADRQLSRHRSDPANRGKTCRRGLWRYSRHPNYFFEWLLWCGFALMAQPAPGGLLGWTSPVVLLLLILKVTGIPPAEERALASRGEDYRQYQRTTSAFVPWFPKYRDKEAIQS